MSFRLSWRRVVISRPVRAFIEEPEDRLGGRKSSKSKRSNAGVALCRMMKEVLEEPEQRFMEGR
jgi:hypothetical protein